MLSSSSGGEVLLWSVDPDPGRLVLNAAYAFLRQQLPHSSSLKVSSRTELDLNRTLKPLWFWYQNSRSRFLSVDQLTLDWARTDWYHGVELKVLVPKQREQDFQLTTGRLASLIKAN